MKPLAPNGTRIRARISEWALWQANDKEVFNDRRWPALEGVPEWTDGPLDFRHVNAPWGEFDSASVLWDGTHVDIEQNSIKVLE